MMAAPIPGSPLRVPTPGCYPDEMCCQTGDTDNAKAECISKRMGCYPQTPPEEGFKWDEEPAWVDWSMNVASTYVWTHATTVRAVMLPLLLSFFLVFLHILVCKSIDGNYCQPAVLPATVVTIAAFFHVFGDPQWRYFVLLCVASWTALVFHNRGDNKVMQGFVVLFVFSTLAIVLGGLSQVRGRLMCDTASYYTLYTPFIHLYSRTYTYVNPMTCIYTIHTPLNTSKHPIYTLYAP